jgi:hypothetical protein
VNNQHRLSGRQITAMVFAVCIAVVAAPVGVFAASRSTVSISDGKHPSHLAHVTATGAQVVAVTGTPAVRGTVAAAPSPPRKPFAKTAFTPANAVNSASVTVPKGTQVVIQTISVKTTVANSVTLTGAEITYQEGGVAETIDFPTPKISAGDTDGDAIFGDTIAVTLYPDPGSTITISPQGVDTDPAVSQLTISGFRS